MGVLKYLIQLEATIQKTEKGNACPDYVDDHVIKVSLDTSQLEKRKWLSCSRAIQHISSMNGIWAIRFLDGVGDIRLIGNSVNDEYENKISSIIERSIHKDIYKFIGFQPLDNYINVLALDRGYYSDIFQLLRIQPNYDNHIDRLIIDYDAPNLEDVLLKRISFFEYSCSEQVPLFHKCVKDVSKEMIRKAKTGNEQNIRKFLYDVAERVEMKYFDMVTHQS